MCYEIYSCALLLSITLGLGACSKTHRDPTRADTRSESTRPSFESRKKTEANQKKPPNIVLVSLDTLRADRLHCYGNPRRTSPFIDQLAKDSVVFRHAYAPSPWTLPSHLSLFTSQYPGSFFRGVLGYEFAGRKLVHPVDYRVGPDARLLAEVLKQHGYDTVGYHGGGYVHSVYGFDRGFRIYKPVEKDRPFSQGAAYLRGRKKSDKPFFLFLHTYIIHQTYRYENVFGVDKKQRPKGLEGVDFVMATLDGQFIITMDEKSPLYRWKPNPEQIDYFKTVYDGGIRYADMLLGTLLETLKDMSFYDDALIVVLSDHGEEFWEHIPEHSPEHNHSLFDELLHVPLMVKFPGRARAGQEVQSTVRLIDVAPTILEVTGIPVAELAPLGESLLPLLNPKKEAMNRELFAGYTQMGPMRYAVRTAHYKYIYAPQSVSFLPSFAVPEEALYDLKNDPEERVNLVDKSTRVVKMMRAKLRDYRQKDLPRHFVLDDSPMGVLNKKYLKALGLDAYRAKLLKQRKPAEKVPQIDKKQMKQLRSLGYMK